MVTPFHTSCLRKQANITKGSHTMQALLIVLALLVEALWLALDKCWLDREQEAVLARYLPDRDHY
ncbi:MULTISPECIES: hypothetical protein [Aquitalea]|uniref:hypothetical protein n=1 Tax=Aquitalea TaxID=407217 RepID=UPI000F5B06C6|nr:MULTISPECIES: hypothetical protein [Aquitalea]